MSDFNRYIERLCNDTAVYWENIGPDGYGGNEYKEPVEIDCRWSDEKELIKSGDGREVISQANLLVVQDLKEGSMVYHGTLSDLDSDQQDSPKKTDAYQILRFTKVPSINGRSYKRKAYL
jgi:hypothetical protein